MNIYIVQCRVICGENTNFLVKANNKKDALEKVWNTHYIYENEKLKNSGYDTYRKADLYIRNISTEVFNSEDVAVI